VSTPGTFIQSDYTLRRALDKQAEKLPFTSGLLDFLKQDMPEVEHLIEGLAPRGGAILVYALPKNLKSWFSIGLTLECAKEGPAFGIFRKPRPVRTLNVQVEDLPSEVQKRYRRLLSTEQWIDSDPSLVSIVPRCPLNLMDKEWQEKLSDAIKTHRAELVILDVLRRLFRGDITSAQDTAAFLEQLDLIREKHKCALMVLHHSRKGGEGEVQERAAGSINITAWADVLISLKAKETEGDVSSAELEIESKVSQPFDTLRLVLELGAKFPLRIVTPTSDESVIRARARLGSDWTAANLADAIEISRRSAFRQIEKWIASGTVYRMSRSGYARYAFSINGDKI
jgi:AAA domain